DQLLRIFQAMEAAVPRRGDRTALLGDNDRQRVRELGDPERRAVARAQGGELPEILRERKMRGKTRHAVALDDDRAVVPRRMRVEDTPKQRLADLAVERDAAHDMARERIVA